MRTLILALILAACAAASSAQAGAVPVISDCGKFSAKPKEITLFCADAGAVLRNLSWSSWGGAKASATGIKSANDCSPNCAAGHFHSYPVAVAAGRLTKCGLSWHYNLLTVRFTRTPPKGQDRVNTFTFTCKR